jgi:hypothetical protein
MTAKMTVTTRSPTKAPTKRTTARPALPLNPNLYQSSVGAFDVELRIRGHLFPVTVAKSKSNGRIASWRMNLEKFPFTIVLVRAIADNRVAVARGIGLYCTISYCTILDCTILDCVVPSLQLQQHHYFYASIVR